MRFMILRRSDADSEAFRKPTKDEMAEMGGYFGSMHAAGVLLSADGLKPSSKGARVNFSKGKPSVVDGPFAETKELIAGYCIIDVPSRADAVAWARKWPASDKSFSLEIREFFEVGDFPAELVPPEEAAKEQKMRDELAAKARK